MKSLTSIALAAAALASLLVIACGEEDITNPTPTPTANTTPANCLRVVEQSWNQQDYDLYKPAISPNFVFYFSPSDVGQNVGGYTIPVSWNAVEMNEAIKNMFNQAYAITMDIPAENIKKPGSGATTFRTGQVEIQLTLLTAPTTGYRIGAGYCIFEFEKYRAGGEDRWRLTRWWDYTQGRRDNAPSSLGRVLTIFR